MAMRTSLLCLTAVVAACGMVSVSAYAGDLSHGSWRPVDCARPMPPASVQTSAQTLNDSVIRYNAYLNEVDSYKACLKAEFDRDAQAMVDSYDIELNTVYQELESAKPPGT